MANTGKNGPPVNPITLTPSSSAKNESNPKVSKDTQLVPDRYQVLYEYCFTHSENLQVGRPSDWKNSSF
ncbi:unnamed protein product [Citrullus colocynthis]|uniref:Uncharacterized protein n=1 Tax=Citrullus colocynthis TaxID=252529 RepID=A0ABP0XYU4_9ROSI